MSNTKTIRQWLALLPNPYREQALTAMDKQRPGQDGTNQSDIGEAIAAAFDWSKTEQGHDYWKSLSTNWSYLTLPPTNALSALHAIALKKGFAVEDIDGIERWREHAEVETWRYRLLATDEWHVITLSNDHP
jgi:hypothetical protein